MSPARTRITAVIEWQGITIEIIYEPNWLNLSREDSDLTAAHLEIRSIAPERAPLPITETGYRSHFLHAEEVDQAGGPEAYVEAWLNDMAESRELRDCIEASRQLNLF